MQTEPPQSFVVTVIPATPAPETTLGDVVVGAFGITGALLLLALVLGIVVAGLRVGWQRLHPAADDHLPPVSPFAQNPDVHRSSQAR